MKRKQKSLYMVWGWYTLTTDGNGHMAETRRKEILGVYSDYDRAAKVRDHMTELVKEIDNNVELVGIVVEEVELDRPTMGFMRLMAEGVILKY